MIPPFADLRNIYKLAVDDIAWKDIELFHDKTHYQ
jgi:hypothetical protein